MSHSRPIPQLAPVRHGVRNGATISRSRIEIRTASCG